MEEHRLLICMGWCMVVAIPADPPTDAAWGPRDHLEVRVGHEDHDMQKADWTWSRDRRVSENGIRVPLCPECTTYLRSLT